MMFRILVLNSWNTEPFFVERVKPLYTQFRGYSWYRNSKGVITVVYE